MNNFDLKEFRVNYAKMTQNELAEKINVSQDRISRWESNPESISISDYAKIAEVFRMKIDDLINFKLMEAKSITVKDTWSSVNETKHQILDYLSTGIQHLPDDAECVNKSEELKKLVHHLFRKPKIGVIGHSDAGKSSLINALLGSDKMPASWTPTTYIAVFVKHINDKPVFVKNNVVLFHGTEGNNVIDDWQIYNHEYFNKYFAGEGDYDLLKEYGTRMGEKASEDITSAIVYVDSPALIDCDFVDLPGYGTGDKESDDRITSDIIEKRIDITIYMSPMNGFMRNDDIALVKNILKRMDDLSCLNDFKNPLSNVFILGSQADFIRKDDRKDILDCGCNRLVSTMGDDFWQTKNRPELFTNEKLRECFFSYSTANNEISESFIQELTTIIEKLPNVIDTSARKMLDKWLLNNDKDIQRKIYSYKTVLNNREEIRQSYQKRIENEDNRKVLYSNERKELLKKIEKYRSHDISEFKKEYDNLIDVDVLEGKIKSRGVKRKKEDIQDFGSYISSTLEEKYTSIMTVDTKLFKSDMDVFFSSLNTNVFSTVGINIDGLSSFSAESIFASGLAGLGTFGALTFWASTCGNLGGYILIAKGLGVLGSLGISFGSAAGVMAAVSALGGPVVIGLAIAITGALAILFGRDWRKDTAKKIVQKFDENDAKSKYLDAVNKYWDDTIASFNAGADKLEQEWTKNLEEERQIIESHDDNSMNQEIIYLKNWQEYFRNVPNIECKYQDMGDI